MLCSAADGTSTPTQAGQHTPKTRHRYRKLSQSFGLDVCDSGEVVYNIPSPKGPTKPSACARGPLSSRTTSKAGLRSCPVELPSQKASGASFGPLCFSLFLQKHVCRLRITLMSVYTRTDGCKTYMPFCSFRDSETIRLIIMYRSNPAWAIVNFGRTWSFVVR